MRAFARRASIDTGAPRRPDLFWKIADVIVPGWFERHEWTQRVVESISENGWVGVAWASNTSKTRNIVGYACLWWLCDPLNSSVTLCSTTIKALRKRGWAEVQSFHTSIPGARLGHMVDSKMMWQSRQGDDKHCIFGRAVEEGAISKVADDIKGVHTTRQMVIIDEATAVPPAIFDACTNLYSYPREFILVMIGNPRSRMDEFGKFCEPKGGWDTVSLEDEEWETGPKLNGLNGLVIRFDAEKSPNIKEGRLVSKHLPTKETVEARKRSPGWENDPGYWSNSRGFWAPEGMIKTIFTETMMLAYDGAGRHKFTGENFRIIGFLDPARTGDRPTLRFGGLGQIEGGKWGLEWCPPIVLVVNAKSRIPIDYQIVSSVKKEAGNIVWRGTPGYRCEPRHFGIDCGGGGADLTDIFQREWSPDIMRIEFGGSASTDACSYENLTPANEKYRNKRAEMHFRARAALEAGQLKGIDLETAKELCTLEFDEARSSNSNQGLLCLISKQDYKARYKKSCDLSDAGVGLLQVARNLGFRLAPMGKTIEKHEDFDKHVETAQKVYAEVDYSDNNFFGNANEQEETLQEVV